MIETFNTDLIFSNKQSKNILSLHVSVSLVESGRTEAPVKTADRINSVSDVIRQTGNYIDTVWSKSISSHVEKSSIVMNHHIFVEFSDC